VESLTKTTHDTLTGHFPLEVRLSENLWKIPYSESFYSIIKTILRSENVFMHMPPTARFVLPGNVYAGVPPHQDISYNKHMTDFITVWVPLVDIDEEGAGRTKNTQLKAFLQNSGKGEFQLIPISLPIAR
jgi:hypothetical protein